MLDRGSRVPVIVFKEALPCELTLLGFYLTWSVRDKIVKGELIDLLSLLPIAKDPVVSSKI